MRSATSLRLEGLGAQGKQSSGLTTTTTATHRRRRTCKNVRGDAQHLTSHVSHDASRGVRGVRRGREGGRQSVCLVAAAAVNDDVVASSSSSSSSAQDLWGPVGSNEAIKSYTPTAAEDARTAVSLVRHGTFCTLASDTGTPFGTHIHYLVDETTGSPIIRVPSDSVDHLNLLKDGKCSLYIHPSGEATDAIARVTLMGNAVYLGNGSEEKVAEVKSDFASVAESLPAIERSYEDLVHDTDEVFRLDVDKAYVRRLACVVTQEKEVEEVDSESYAAAAADPLAFVAPYMVKKWNAEQLEDVVRFTEILTSKTIKDLEMVKLLWLDKQGLYIRYQVFGDHPRDVRMGFPQPVDNEKALVSTLTMLGQVTWE
eukprot:CAMPEP_0182610594 /NCGR_PEP_ID=MMETSP1330-20130603/9011_1 /TAXON_ID=464278 /ORGANISM="Picochlorum sp., Strain RCC944" /LENGTH=369 /DNA_ID=CAMNT_0024829813 /DNA_START=260 /DNA_END=1366 /DNA_ORIENTATION=-